MKKADLIMQECSDEQTPLYYPALQRPYQLCFSNKKPSTMTKMTDCKTYSCDTMNKIIHILYLQFCTMTTLLY